MLTHILFLRQWSNNYIRKFQDWWTLDSLKKNMLLNGHTLPILAISKKNGTIRVVSDFRKLNSLLKPHPFPIPNIGDIIRSMEGFTFATSLDLNVGYYHIKLDPDAQRLCTIIFPWGKYKYKRLPMGIKIAPDVFQNVMTKLNQDMEYVKPILMICWYLLINVSMTT
jgi:Reverse transcriptase (RNA-dependent DNA polymerase)